MGSRGSVITGLLISLLLKQPDSVLGVSDKLQESRQVRGVEYTSTTTLTAGTVSLYKENIHN